MIIYPSHLTHNFLFLLLILVVNVFGRLPTSWRALALLRNPLALFDDVNLVAPLVQGIPGLTHTHTHPEEVDYGDEENNPLPSINPPPGTEIARGVPDPPPPSDTATGDSTHQTITSP